MTRKKEKIIRTREEKLRVTVTKIFSQSQTTAKDTRIDTPSNVGRTKKPAVTSGRDESLHYEVGHSPENHTVLLANTDEQQVHRTSQTTLL